MLRPPRTPSSRAGRHRRGLPSSQSRPVPEPRHETRLTPEVSAPFDLEEPTYPVVPFTATESSPTAEITANDEQIPGEPGGRGEDEERPGTNPRRNMTVSSCPGPGRRAAPGGLGLPPVTPRPRPTASCPRSAPTGTPTRPATPPAASAACCSTRLPATVRASLGWAVSSGQRVELVCAGPHRAPAPSRRTSHHDRPDCPALTVDSPELLISRTTFLLLDVDEWSVLAQTCPPNGTILHREGSSPCACRLASP